MIERRENAARSEKDVLHDIGLVKARQNILTVADALVDEGDVIDRVERRTIGIAVQLSDRAVDGEGRNTLDQFLARLPVGDHVSDGDMLEVVLGRELHDLFALHHRAIVVHQFADDADRRQVAQLAEIDRGFGMTRTQQHPAVARDQREDVAGTRKVAGARIGIGQRPAAHGPLLGRNAGGHAGLVVDRHGESGGMVGIVMSDHRVEPQAAGVVGRDRRADDP